MAPGILIAFFSLIPASSLIAEVIDIEVQADHQIVQKIVSARSSGAIEIQVKGFYEFPRFDPAVFKILRYEVEPGILAIGMGWTPGTYSFCRSGIALGYGINDGSLSDNINGPGAQGTQYSFKRGSISSYTNPPTTIDLLAKAPDRIYGRGVLELYFWLQGGGGGTRGGGMGYLRWGRPTLHIQLEKISPLTPNPIFISTDLSKPLSYSELQSETGADRPPPSIFAGQQDLPPDLTTTLPITWTTISPRTFGGKIYAFSDYRYRVMRSSNLIDKDEIQTFDGADRIESIQIDGAAYPEEKNFFWIEETPIPQSR